MLQDSVRRFVENAYTFEARTALLETGQGGSAVNWRSFAENGWLGAAVPEPCGGFGGTVLETALIAHEFGRGLVIEPYLGCAVLAAQTLVASESSGVRQQLLPGLVDGTIRCAVAYSESGSCGMPLPVALRANRTSDGYVLNGSKSLVLGGRDAEWFIVSGVVANQANPADITLFLVNAEAPGLSRQALPLHDGSWAAEVVLENVFVPTDMVLGQPGQGMPALRHGLMHATVALCSELVGAMERAIEITADYLKLRKQFGVAIGSFQALQHRMADMAAELELSRSMLFALLAAIEGTDAAHKERMVSQAKTLISRAAKKVCGQAIQLHGGIGVTEECSVGHYFKRAVVGDVLLGSADRHEAHSAVQLQSELQGLGR